MKAMSPFHEKIFFGVTNLATSTILYLAAIFSPQETRWLFVTASVSVLTCGFMALMFKQPNETIQLIVGRCGIALLGGIFLTMPVSWYFDIQTVHSNVVALGGLACLVCIVTFSLGYAALKYLEKKNDWFAKKFIDGTMDRIMPPQSEEK